MGPKAFATTLVAMVAASMPLLAQEDQIGARGFEVDKVFNVGDVDSISLFNGNLTITLPIGQTYPVNGNLAYGFNAVYNSLIWEVGDRYDAEDDVTYSFANISRLWNAGAGWMISPGRLFEPKLEPENPIEEDAWLYVDPSGAKHWFRNELHPGVDDGSSKYTNDSTYSRMRVVGAERHIEFPNGNVTVFEDEGTSGSQDWRVTRMLDAFGNEVNVARFTNADEPATIPVGDVWERYTDDHLRTQELRFESDPHASDRRLYEARLTAFGGATATYSLTYDDLQIDRCYRDNDPDTPSQIWISILTEIALPDGTTYEMPDGASIPAYNDSCAAGEVLSGAIRRLRLRTKGEIEWDYSNYWLPYVLVPGQPGSGDRGEFEAGARGVSTRRELDTDESVLGTWRYTNEAVMVTDIGDTVLLDGETVTYVEYPTGDCSKHHFRGNPNERRSYGLPFSESAGADAAGTFLSTEVWNGTTNGPTGEDPDFPASFFCSGTKYRSSRVLYEDDGPSTTSDVNRRLVKSRTIYHLDGERIADTTFSDFDGLGHYETETTGGTFAAGNVRTTTTDYEPFVGTSLVGGVDLPLSTSKWILDTFQRRDVTEGSETRRETFCFDAFGFMTHRRQFKSETGTLDGNGEPDNRSGNDIVTEFARNGVGNLRFERYYGADTQPTLSTSSPICSLTAPGDSQYALEHQYGSGTRRFTRYLDPNSSLKLKLFDHTIDPSTGLVSSTESPDEITTVLTYDSLGRLTAEQPETGHGAWVNIQYTNADTSTNAQVDIVRCPNGFATCTPVLAEEQVVFDDLGRVFREKRKVPTDSGSIFNLRETLYNGRGWKSSVSEVVADGASPSDVTEFLEYDPFGRPGRIRPADGAIHDVVLGYQGVSQVERTVMIEGPEGEIPSKTTEIFDRQGRLQQVIEPAVSGGVLPTTTYEYDAGNRLKNVSMTDGTTTQTRLFTYDGRGFLESEQHPEKGLAGNGVVTYPIYDARGHARQKVDGSNDLTLTFDWAERLTDLEETGGLDLKEFTYGTASGITKGKLLSAVRHNYLPAPMGDTAIEETYEYNGTGGRVSRRLTRVGGADWFDQSFSWTDLGEPQSLTYPVCGLAACASSGQPNRVITNGYSDGFLTTVGETPTTYATLEYHPNEMLASIAHLNQVGEIWEPDPNSMRRPARIRSTGLSPALTFDTGTYAYDGAGNIKSMVVDAMNGDFFTYDGLSRLVTGSSQLGQAPESSTYDAFGNRTASTTLPVGSRAIPVDPGTNRLLGNPDRPVAYDDRGNQTLWGTVDYSYDALDQISRLEDTSTTKDELFIYTADDERIATLDAQSLPSTPLPATWVIRDLDGLVLREFSGSSDGSGIWSWLSDTVHRQGQVLARDVPGAFSHAHLDHLGTVRMWTPEDVLQPGGGLPSRYNYTAFGEEIGDNQLHGDLRFTGHERDRLRTGGCSGTTEVDGEFLEDGETKVGCDTLTSEGTTVAGTLEVRFKAGDSIALKDFTIQTGASFVAEIDGGLNSDLQDLDYMHARYCSPVAGRFLGPDPIDSGKPSKPQSWNQYAYGLGNPLKYVDPDGKQNMLVVPEQVPPISAPSNATAATFKLGRRADLGPVEVSGMYVLGIEQSNGELTNIGVGAEVALGVGPETNLPFDLTFGKDSAELSFESIALERSALPLKTEQTFNMRFGFVEVDPKAGNGKVTTDVGFGIGYRIMGTTRDLYNHIANVINTLVLEAQDPSGEKRAVFRAK